MKKALYILFLAVYLFLTIGVNISAHFCGDELIAVSIVTPHSKSEPDGCCAEPCGDECCHNKITTIKLEDTQKTQAVKTIDNLFASALPEYPSETEILYSELSIPPTTIAHSPPGNKAYILNCSYLI